MCRAPGLAPHPPQVHRHGETPLHIAVLFLAFGCVQQPSDSGPPDTSDTAPVDTSGDSDTSGETASDSDTADTSETGETGVPPLILPGSVTLTGTVQGIPVNLTCDETTSPELFIRYWASSLGNISGTVICANDLGQRFTLTFINPAAGSWTDTSDGKSWSYEDSSGLVLAYGVRNTTSWAMAFTTYAWLDTTTFELEGTVAGSWTTAEGEALGDLSGVFGLEVAGA